MRVLSLILVFYIIFSCAESKQKESAEQQDVIKQDYLKKGAEVVSLTQSELLKNVSLAMKKGGPGYAIEYCNLRALSLKDSLSRLNNCQIKRISLKYRNPVDKAQTEQEKEQLLHYQDAYQKGGSLEAKVFIFADRIEYYEPIMLAKEACLKCHGDPGTHIAEETLLKIEERYPNDLATGFALNDFRGAWKITFKK